MGIGRLADALALISDLERLVYEFFDSIERYTLQIYVHALLFTPKTTMLYRTYFASIREDFCLPDLVIGASLRWNTCLRTITASKRVHCIATSPKLAIMAFGTESESVIVCHLESGATVATLLADGCDSEVRAITFLADGRLRAGFCDGTIATWDGDRVLGSQCEQGALGD